MDVIDLGAGDNDTPPPAVAVEAMTRGARTIPPTASTGSSRVCPAFRQAASRWVERRFGLRFDPMTETLPLIGSKEGLSHLPFAVVNPGDATIVPEPGYQAYLGGSILAGAEPYIAPLRPENDFLLDLEQVPEAVLRRAKLVFVNYPNNPTAAVAPLGVSRAHGGRSAAATGSCSPTTTPTAISPSTVIGRRASSRSRARATSRSSSSRSPRASR